MPKRAAIALLVAVFVASPAVAAEISPGFQAYLDASDDDEVVGGILYLTDQVDLVNLQAQLDAGRVSPQERHKTVIEALQAMAAITQPKVIAQLEDLRSRGLVEGYTPYWIANLIVVGGRKAAFYELAQRVDVDRIEVNFQAELIEPIRTGGGNNIETNQVTPGVRACWADSVWYQYGITGAGRVIAGMDTGVDGTHPALSARWGGLRPGYLWNWAWKDPLFGTTFPTDGNAHGTHTMGTMTGLGAPTADTIGIAWGAWWIADRSIAGGTGSTFDNNVTAGYQWMSDPDGNSGTVDDRPDACQNSWGINEGFPGYVDCDTRWQAVINGLEAAGCAVIYSAGNEGPGAGTLRSPADYMSSENTNFSIGAVDATSYSWPYPIASFSSRGPSTCSGHTPPLDIKPEVVAPGVNVFSSVPGGGYNGTYSGTSMAGPHAAGIYALMRQANPAITVQQMKDLMRTTARELPAYPGNNDTTGYGMVNALGCVEGALALSTYGWVEGTVTASGGGPIQGATVTVVGYGTGTTNASGYYITMGDAGLRTLICEAFGYLPDTVNVTLATGDTVVQNFVLSSGAVGTLQGTVTTNVGVPIQGAVLTLIGTPMTPETTDASGFYQFLNNVPQGNYDLACSHQFYVDDTANVTITAGGTTVQNFSLAPEPTYTGPDAYGYYAYDYSDSQYTEWPAYGWYDISGFGTNGPSGDDAGLLVTLPFTFRYYGTNYTTVYICTNGWVVIGASPGTNAYSNTPIPTAAQPNGTFPWWDDLYANAGVIKYYNDATNHRFIVQYTAVPYYSGGGTETFQVVLMDPVYDTTATGDGEIYFYYADDHNQQSSTVGIERPTGATGIQYEYNGTYGSHAASLGASTVVKFTTDPPQVLQPAFIAVTSPSTGSVWYVDSARTIAWSSSGTSGTVDIHYSTNGGGAWTTVVLGTPDDGSHPWTVPNAPSTDCLVRVRDTDGSPSSTSGTFEIRPTPVVAVTYPNGGETLDINSQYDLTYNVGSSVGVDSVVLEYSTDNGGSWTWIMADVNGSPYSWTVPNAPSTQCLLRATIYDDQGTHTNDASNSVWAIADLTAPTNTVVYPNGGETVGTGNAVALIWTSDDQLDATVSAAGRIKPIVAERARSRASSAAVLASDEKDDKGGGAPDVVAVDSLWYSLDNGGSWTFIAAITNGDTSYAWTAPNSPSAQCLIRLKTVDGNGNATVDLSNGVWTIADDDPPGVAVAYPNGGETIYVDSVAVIHWAASDNVALDSALVQYSVNNGGAWSTIASVNPNDTSYTWTVAGPPTDSALVRVIACDAAGNCANDASDGMFTIIDMSDVPEWARGAIPTRYDLLPAFPNPFNPTVTFRFALPEPSHVRLTVYDVLGRCVATLVDENLPAKWHVFRWDAGDLPSGVYIARVVAGRFTETCKMMMLK